MKALMCERNAKTLNHVTQELLDNVAALMSSH